MQVDGKESQDIKITIDIRSDGILLYVSEASYQAVSVFFWYIHAKLKSIQQGDTPLSVWVPVAAMDKADGDLPNGPMTPPECPLDLFERLLRKRVEKGTYSNNMEMS
jgi:hypothetical protein